MRTAEKTIIIITIIGILFRIMHWPGGGPLLVFALSALACFYMFLSWGVMRDRETKKGKLPVTIPIGFGLSMACIGIMFKLQLWPGGYDNLIISVIILLVACIGCIYGYSRSKDIDKGMEGYYKAVLKRVVPFLMLASAMLLIPNSSIIRFYYGDDEERTRLLIQYYDDPENQVYRKALEDYELRKFNNDTLNHKP